MESFTAGLIVGCIIGAMGVLLCLLYVHAIPDGFPRAREKELLPVWQFSALVMLLMLVAKVAYELLKLQRLSLLAMVLLFLVFLTAKIRGLLAALATLTFASILMSYVLPPSKTIWIAGSTDRLLLAIFVVFGVVVSRFVGRRQQPL